MCGICLLIGGLPIEQHQFDFNFFESYLCKSTIALNQHIIDNKLQLSDTVNPIQIAKQLTKRGPDNITVHQIDLFKTNYKVNNSLREQYIIPKGQAIGFQSVLHLRGQQFYITETPGSYFLFNGQIWDTGSLSGFEKDQNDGKWLHETLMQCKGSKQIIAETLTEIRGDFAFILLQGDQLFLAKDYFGKRSLLVGMGNNYLAISSVPIEQCVRALQEKDNNNNNNQNEQEAEGSWKTKYQAEWLSSKNKNFFQIPSNTIISIDLKNDISLWSQTKIHKLDLKNIPKSPQNNQENIKSCIKKLLIDNIKQLTRSIKYMGQKFNKQTKIAVLFSGGVDSSLVARMLDLVLPQTQQIDLINLAFRKDAPDRQAGKISYQQLRMLNPNRKYNLICLDHTLNDIEIIQKQLIYSIYPKTTHMDFNIAAALYLASNVKPKIIFTGLGADQIFGGYSRYRIAYKRGGFQQLENQMIFDMERLWIRNLGRDDRAISSRGKQVRYPFLYLPLWTYLRSIQSNQLTEGNGQKMLLRKIAKEFGLEKASNFKKKAIQFGTRLAKLSNVKCFGSNRKAKGNLEYQ